MFSYTILRFPMQTLSEKNETCVDGEVWICETRELKHKCNFWMFRTVELSMLGSKSLIFHSYATLQISSVQLQFCSEQATSQIVVRGYGGICV